MSATFRLYRFEPRFSLEDSCCLIDRKVLEEKMNIAEPPFVLVEKLEEAGSSGTSPTPAECVDCAAQHNSAAVLRPGIGGFDGRLTACCDS